MHTYGSSPFLGAEIDYRVSRITADVTSTRRSRLQRRAARTRRAEAQTDRALRRLERAAGPDTLG